MPLSYLDNDVIKILTPPRINALLAARERGTWAGARAATRRGDARSVRILVEELEQRLGYNIITPDSRKGTNVVLTREGKELADHCVR